jgi:hypothetical protein
MSLKLQDGTPAESEKPTPYAVICSGDPYPQCNDGKPIYLTDACYRVQMMRPDDRWKCPRCGGLAEFDDDTFEYWMEQQDAAI